MILIFVLFLNLYEEFLVTDNINEYSLENKSSQWYISFVSVKMLEILEYRRQYIGVIMEGNGNTSKQIDI